MNGNWLIASLKPGIEPGVVLTVARCPAYFVVNRSLRRLLPVDADGRLMRQPLVFGRDGFEVVVQAVRRSAPATASARSVRARYSRFCGMRPSTPPSRKQPRSCRSRVHGSPSTHRGSC